MEEGPHTSKDFKALRLKIMNMFLLMQMMKQTSGHVAQSVTCLTADPGIASSILAWSYTYTFVEIDHKIISTSKACKALRLKVMNMFHLMQIIKQTLGRVAQSGNMPDCRSRDDKFDPGLVPYFHGD